MDCDLVIIGSGFGGSVVALRAAQAGMRVVVLERGARMDDAAFARLADGRDRLIVPAVGRAAPRADALRGGFLEVRTIPGLTGIVGRGVGGGSHHYTSVTVAARDDVFASGWPADWTAESMHPRYARVAERLRLAPIAAPSPQTRAIETLGGRLGAPTRRLPLALDPAAAPPTLPPGSGWRRDLIGWFRGDGTGARISLDDAYLRPAETLGAQLRPHCTVTRLGRATDGYRVEFIQRIAGRLVSAVLHAPRVVLAAGTLATVRLLLEARDVHRSLPRLSPALGCGFTTNGDFGAILLGPRVPFPDERSPVATAWIDFWEKDRLLLMDLGRLPIARRWLRRWLPAALRLRDWSRRFSLYAYTPAAPVAWIIGGMGAAAARGRLRLDRRGGMAHERQSRDNAFDRCMANRLRDVAQAAGATLLRLPLWLARLHPMTVHPLGGCGLADSPERGVCDPNGQAFGCPGLYVADGSVLPTPCGCPPSMTIAATAERIAEMLTQ